MLFDKKFNGIGYDRNGNGKEIEYYKMHISFNGVYLNGLKHGFGIEYDQSGRLEYKGNFLNGKRHGAGGECDLGGKIKYKGKFINGKRGKDCEIF